MTRRKKTTNNKGFSLLELLVSMTIFAVVAIPLLHGFVTAALTNSKAKKVMEATTVAQNLVEEVKVETTSPEDGSSGYTLDGTSYVKTCNDGVNGRTFYEEVRLTPRDSSKINIAQISTMDSETSSTFSVTSQMTDRAKYKIDPTGSIGNSLVRDIQLTITQADPTDPITVTTQLVFSYGSKTVKMYDVPYTIYKGSELKDIYLFFEPMNNSLQEKITVDNSNNVPVNLYLVKQGTNDCSALLTVTEKTHADVTTRVITNLTTSLTNGQLAVKLNTTDDVPQLQLLGESGLTAVGLAARDQAETEKEWLATLDSTMIYDIEVKVYEKDGGKLLTTLTGTKMQ